MGKRIIAQRRGKGSMTYRVPNYKFRPNVRFRDKRGRVVDIVKGRIMLSPLAKIKYEDGESGYIIAPEGISVGESVDNIIVPLSKVSIGKQIFAIETCPNSGPKLCRTPGSSAILVSKGRKECVIRLPTKKKKKLHPRCRAILGIPAGEGREEKPMVKAGKNWHAMHARGKLYPRTSGVAMNAVDHPFGGGYTGLGKHKSISRNTPPGRKVGSISPRRSGRKKK